MGNLGGARPGAGRPRGAISKAKRDLASKAQEHADLALRVLVDIAAAGESESARVTAANAILDRGYGRAFQSVQVTGADEGPVQIIDPSKMSADALRELLGAVSHDNASEADES